MSPDSPEPGALFNDGPPTEPRPAATVILMRGGAERLEVLLVKRTPSARFMGGAWVFPGGAVDRSEGSGQPALRAAAVRELREEAGISLSADAELVLYARWITPRELKIRFDTCFYLAAAPDDAVVQVDGSEIVDSAWLSPDDALAANGAGDVLLAFPTIRQLEQLSSFASADELLAHARETEVVPVEPRVRIDPDGATVRVVLPGEAGFESAHG